MHFTLETAKTFVTPLNQSMDNTGSLMIITSMAITNKHLRKTSNTRALLRTLAIGQEKGVPLAISARIITPLATTNKH